MKYIDFDQWARLHEWRASLKRPHFLSERFTQGNWVSEIYSLSNLTFKQLTSSSSFVPWFRCGEIFCEKCCHYRRRLSRDAQPSKDGHYYRVSFWLWKMKKMKRITENKYAVLSIYIHNKTTAEERIDKILFKDLQLVELLWMYSIVEFSLVNFWKNH